MVVNGTGCRVAFGASSDGLTSVLNVTDASDVWSTPQGVTPEEHYAGDPWLSQNGNTLAYENAALTGQGTFAVRNSDGVWGPAEELSDPDADIAGTDHVTTSADGDIVAWHQTNSTFELTV